MPTYTPVPDELLEKIERTAEAATPPEGQESSPGSIAHLVELKRVVTPEVLGSLVAEVREWRRQELPRRPGVEQLLVRK